MKTCRGRTLIHCPRELRLPKTFAGDVRLAVIEENVRDIRVAREVLDACVEDVEVARPST